MESRQYIIQLADMHKTELLDTIGNLRTSVDGQNPTSKQRFTPNHKPTVNRLRKITVNRRHKANWIRKPTDLSWCEELWKISEKKKRKIFFYQNQKKMCEKILFKVYAIIYKTVSC